MQAIPPYGYRANYSTANHFPSFVYPITTYGNMDAAMQKGLDATLQAIKSFTVRTETDLVTVTNLVLNAVGIETGTQESHEKRKSLSEKAQKAISIPTKVAVMQRLAELTKKKNAIMTNDAIWNGFAYEYYCNVEFPGVCATKTLPEIKEDVVKMLEVPFYKKPIFYIPTAIGVLSILVWRFK